MGSYASSAVAHSSSFLHGISGATLSASSFVPVRPAIPILRRRHHATELLFGVPHLVVLLLRTLHLSNLSSGPLFFSGPINRGAQLSGPLDPTMPFSGPLPAKPTKPASSSSRGHSRRFWKPSFGSLRWSVSKKNRPLMVPPRCDDGVQWAHDRAGEDCIHVVVSEDQRWLFVSIYDGFNGPEAPDFLVANLYRFLLRELCRIFYEDADMDTKRLWQFLVGGGGDDSELDFLG